MILNARGISLGNGNAFHCIVIDVDLRDDGSSSLKRVWINGVTVVLGCDCHLASLQIFYCMVASSVSEFHFEGGSTGGMTEKLVSETDAKHWASAKKRLDSFNYRSKALWVTGTR